MWPFSEMSLSTASLVGTIANWGLLISLLAGLLSTFVIVKTTDVKEEHWDHARQESGERIAELNKEAARLSAEAEIARGEIARANQGAAEANARTKEAELKLAETREKLGRPRQLDVAPFLAALKDVPPTPVEVTVVGPDPDSHWIASSIWSALEKVGWPIIQGGSIEMFRETPPLIRTCAGKIGRISVLSKNITNEEAEYIRTPPGPKRPDTPFFALWDALSKAIGVNEVVFATCPFLPDGQLHVVVAPRWVIFPQESPAPAGPSETTK